MSDNNIRKSIKARKSDGAHSPATEDTRDIFEKALDNKYGVTGAALGALAGAKMNNKFKSMRALDTLVTGGIGFGIGRAIDNAPSKKNRARK